MSENTGWVKPGMSKFKDLKSRFEALAAEMVKVDQARIEQLHKVIEAKVNHEKEEQAKKAGK